MSVDELVIRGVSGLAGVRHLEQYSGLWAMEEGAFRAALEQVACLDLTAHVSASVEQAAISGVTRDVLLEQVYHVDDGVGVIDVVGRMTKYGSSLSQMAGGTITVRRAVREAVRDPRVRGIVLRVDSPGGTVAGTGDLAREVQQARQQKPVVAYIEDTGASAAYWVASQASRVVVNGEALVGSIGTYGVLTDVSAQAEALGIKVHVIRAGEMKGAGEPGTPITDAHLAEYQRMVNELNAAFLRGVSQGRGLPMERIEGLADGRVHIGPAAVALGLADEVGTFEGAMNWVRGGGVRRVAGTRADAELEVVTMADEKERATVEQIESACEGADAGFVLAQYKRGASVVEAQSAWNAELRKRVAAAEAKAAEAEAKALEAATKAAETRPGVAALSESKAGQKREPGGDGYDGDPIEAFEGRVRDRMARGQARESAVTAVSKQDPALHRAYLFAKNADNPRALEQLRQKYGS